MPQGVRSAKVYRCLNNHWWWALKMGGPFSGFEPTVCPTCSYPGEPTGYRDSLNVNFLGAPFTPPMSITNASIGSDSTSSDSISLSSRVSCLHCNAEDQFPGTNCDLCHGYIPNEG